MNRKQRRLNSKNSGNKSFEDTQKQSLINKGINTASDLIKLGKFDEAEALYMGLKEHAPQNGRIFYGLGVIAHKRKRFEDAYDFMHEALKLDAKDHKALVAMGFILLDLNQADAAIEYCEKSLRIDRNSENTALYGTTLKLLGHFEESEKLFWESLSYDDKNILSYKEIIASRKVTEDNKAFIALKNIYTDSMDDLDDEDQIRVNFALGKAYFDLKNYDASFKHYKEGNDAKQKQYGIARTAMGGFIKRIPEDFTKDVLKKHKGTGQNSDVPIFIVGMPRSGTTLTEQILASHHKVHGAGELTAFLNCALYPDEPQKHGQIGGADGKINKHYLDNLTPEVLKKLGQNYVTFATKNAPESATRVVDKMPFNFKNVGLIKLALPNAKIIYSRRNPMDIGMSIYRQLFSEDMGFAYGLEDIGAVIKECDALMDYWKELLGDDLFVSNYEDLVQKPEEQTRKLIEYCGLDWDDACLSPHKNTRSVKTASFAQVRAPINTKSIEGWRRFETGLKPLADYLGL